MESPPKSPETKPTLPKRSRRAAVWFAFFGILLLMPIVLAIFMAAANKNLVWLTPADLKSVNHNGPLTQLKYRIKDLIMPVWKHFQRKPQIVELDANISAVSRDAAGEINLGKPIATRTDGARAWILSPLQLTDFHHFLKTNSGFLVLDSPRVMTLEGMQAQVQMANMIVGRINASDPSPTTAVGMIVDLTPKVVSGSVRVTMGASYTSFIGWSPEKLLLLKTNFAAICQVLIPNAGALVMDGGLANPDGTNYWLIISPTLVDAQGKPIKP